ACCRRCGSSGSACWHGPMRSFAPCGRPTSPTTAPRSPQPATATRNAVVRSWRCCARLRAKRTSRRCASHSPGRWRATRTSCRWSCRTIPASSPTRWARSSSSSPPPNWRAWSPLRRWIHRATRRPRRSRSRTVSSMRSPEKAAVAAEDTRERILQAAEAVLRRYGLAKTTVVDVARALDMSHANVYRHFESKAALLDALVERWLAAIAEPLAAIAERDGPAALRLEEWFLTLIDFKRRNILGEPELFATYHAATEAARGVVEAHLARYHDHLVRILRDGVANGEWAVSDPDTAARIVRNAMRVYFDPHHVKADAGQRSDEEVREEARRSLRLVVAGLAAG